jgi:phosphohistidine phosphatase
VRLILLRHATAVQRGLNGYADGDRPLIEAGEREARWAGVALRRMRITPPALVASPLVRAVETARLAAAAIGAEVVEDDALASGLGLVALRDLLARHPYDPLVLVGHDPDFSELVEDLTGARVQLAKCGIAAIEWESEPARSGCELRFLLRPRQLRAMAQKEPAA